MAEAICKSLGHSADSAGTHPGSEVNPNAIRALEEKGIESAGLRPKSIDDIVTDGYDKIISMGVGFIARIFVLTTTGGSMTLTESH